MPAKIKKDELQHLKYLVATGDFVLYNNFIQALLEKHGCKLDEYGIDLREGFLVPVHLTATFEREQQKRLAKQ